MSVNKTQSLKEPASASRPTTLNILFVCTTNACRSQIAEGWARALHRDAVNIFSAGVLSTELNPNAVQVMSEVGIDMGHHVSKAVTAEDFEAADIIVTVCEQADRRCPPLPAGKIKYHWPIKNPVTARDKVMTEKEHREELEAMRQCRDEIQKRILILFQMEGISYTAAKSGESLQQASSPSVSTHSSAVVVS